MKRRKCPNRKSPLHRDSSMILTANSRNGWDIMEAPSPRPYHLPVHHALLVSSCLYSRDKNTDMKTLLSARWMAIIAIRPRTAREASHRSKNHCMTQQ